MKFLEPFRVSLHRQRSESPGPLCRDPSDVDSGHARSHQSLRLVIQPTAIRGRRRKEEAARDCNRPGPPRHRRRISRELEFNPAKMLASDRPVGDVTQYFRFGRTRDDVNELSSPATSSECYSSSFPFCFVDLSTCHQRSWTQLAVNVRDPRR